MQPKGTPKPKEIASASHAEKYSKNNALRYRFLDPKYRGPQIMQLPIEVQGDSAADWGPSRLGVPLPLVFGSDFKRFVNGTISN